MNESVFSSQKSKEGFFSAFSAGAFLVLLGAIFITTPGFFDSVSAFFLDFGTVEVPNFISGFFLPAPKNLADHTTVYSAAIHFSLAWGIFLIGLLMLRLFAGSPLRKKAENASDIVFWLVGSFLISIFLNETTTLTMWFEFWAVIIMLLGVSLVIRAIILAMFKVRT